MNSIGSPGDGVKATSLPVPAAARMRSRRDETKFHQIWRGPSIGSPPSISASLARAARIVMRSPGRNTSRLPRLEAVAGDVDLAGDDIERALLVVGIERQHGARRQHGTSA